MKPERSLPRLQQLATRSYPEPEQSDPCPQPFFKIYFSVILPSTPGSS